MSAEAELLLMNASRAQLVREIIRPALWTGEIVVCGRFYDSTTAYQGYGRGLDLSFVRTVIDFAVGEVRPDLTLLLTIPVEISEVRRRERAESNQPLRDRFEESGRDFFLRVEKGYQAIASAEPDRVQLIDGAQRPEVVAERVWQVISARLPKLDV